MWGGGDLREQARGVRRVEPRYYASPELEGRTEQRKKGGRQAEL